jgi:hypothetical protein
MANTLAIRQTIHDLIDDIPEHKLHALHPLLCILIEEDTDDDEDDILSDEEYALLKKCLMDQKNSPENFIPWTEIRVHERYE